MENKISFTLRTGELIIDLDKCVGCEAYECVKACSLYGRHLFRIELGSWGPIPIYDKDEFRRRCIECIACEIMCPNQAIRLILTIEVDY